MAVKVDGAQVGPTFSDTPCRRCRALPTRHRLEGRSRLVHGHGRVHDAGLRIDRCGPAQFGVALDDVTVDP